MTNYHQPDGSRLRRRRLRLWLVLSFSVCVTMAAGIWWLRRMPVRPVPAPPIADLTGSDPQIAASVERARKDVTLKPHSGAAWGNLGSVLVVHKFHHEALTCLAEAEKLQPEEPRWPYLQGIVLLSWDPDAAIPKLMRGAELSGDAVAPRLRLAHLLIERGRLDEAEKYLQTVMSKHPDTPRAILGMGKLELARERLPEAVKHLERSAAIPQTARASTALLATIQQRLGNASLADAASRRLAGMPRDPGLPDPFLEEMANLQVGLEAMLNRADRLSKSGRIREGLALHEKAVAAYPDSATAWRLLGQARIEEMNYPAAEKALRKGLELGPQDSEIHFQLGSALFLQNAATQAAECFRRSAELSPSYAPAYYNLGICLSTEGKRVEAIQSFRAAIRYDPAFADAHRWLGATLALEMRFTEALEPLQRAVELNPEDKAAAQMIERAKLRGEEQPQPQAQ